jgi:PAS domain S-box-containing protein
MNGTTSRAITSSVAAGQGAALIATATALACRLALDPFLDGQLPYVTFFAAIAFSTWYGGVAAGLTATLLGGLAAVWFFIPPRLSFEVSDVSQLVGLFTYAAVSLTFVAFGHAMQRARHRAEELAQGLRVTEERLALAQEAAQVGSFDWNLETGINTWSPELCAMYGLRPDGFGKTQADWERYVHPDDRDMMVQAVERSRASGEAEDREFRIIRPNGEVRWLVGRWRWIRDSSGRPVRLTGVNFDISQQKQNQEALRRSENELSEFFENASLGIHWVGADGMILRVNQAELDLLGYSREEYVGRHIGDFHVDQPVLSEILRRLSCGETLREYPARLRCKDGSVRDVLINSNARFEDGQFVHTRCFTRDVTDRKSSEERLRQSEAMARAVFESSLDPLITMDEEGRIQDFNPAAETTFGYSKSQAVGRMFTDLIVPPHWRERYKQGLRRYGETGEAMVLGRRVQMPALRADRTEIPVECSITATRRPGLAPFFTVALRDISDRLRSERVTAHLAAIVRSSDDAIISKDLNGIVTTWNQAAERLFGYRADEMIGQPILKLIPMERQDEEREILGKISRGETIKTYETIRCRKDGTHFHVSLTISPLFDGQGRVIGASKIARDISERVEHEHVLAQNRERLRQALQYQEAIVTNMGEGLYTINRQGQLVSMNRAAETLFGWTKEELAGRKMHDLTHYKRRDGTRCSAEDCAEMQVFARGVALLNHEDVFIRKDGSFFDVVYSAAPMWSGDEVTGLVVVFHDVTEQRRAEQALRDRDRALTAANDELTGQKAGLAEANRELQSFSYSVSHDLRAPLRTIDAYVRIVEEDHGPHLNDEVRRCLAIISKAAGQAGELIDDLLEFSRLGRIGMDFRPTNMTDIAREAAQELSLTQGREDLDLRIGDLPSSHGDWRLLKLVWTNLLSNAFKFTRGRTAAHIEVGWLPDDRQPDACVYYVKDNGVGFDMRYVHKLFGVFQRLHLKDEFEGTGVGLAIVQRIVQRHGGRVWAEGKIDGGATFFFSLRKASR